MSKIKYRAKHPSQFGTDQQQIVYFRVRKPIEQSADEQLIVNRHPRKRNNERQPLNQQQKIEKDNDNLYEITNMFSELNLKKSVQYFLKRVDDIPKIYNNKAEQIVQNQILPKSEQLSSGMRKNNREKLIQNSRKMPIKIVDIGVDSDEDEDHIELQNKKIKIQNLATNDYYYILKKRNAIKSGPQVHLPEGSMYLLENIQFDQHISDQGDKNSDDEEDSNRESNPDYDYPEEDYEENSGSDQGVIKKDYYVGNSDQEEYQQNDEELDEQEIYRRYLKRCNKKGQSSDDEYF